MRDRHQSPRRATARLLAFLVAATIALAGSGARAETPPGYRLCADARCQASPVLGVPVVLDADGDGAPDLIGEVGLLDPSSPAAGDLLRVDLVRLSDVVRAHVFAEVVTGGGTVRIGVDGRAATVPQQVHVTVSEASDTTTIRSSWSDVPSGVRLTLAKGARSMSILEPAADFHGTLALIEGADEREMRWSGSPIKVLDAVVPGRVAFTGRLTDVPAEAQLTIEDTASVTTLLVSASDATLDIEGAASKSGTTYDIRATNLGATATIVYDRAQSSFTVNSTPPLAYLELGAPLQLRSTCRDTIGNVDISSTVDATAPNFKLTGWGIGRLTLWKSCATLKAEGAFTRVDGTLGAGARAVSETCVGDTCRTRESTSFSYHRFVDAWDENIGRCGINKHWRGLPKRVGQRDDGTFVLVAPKSMTDTQWIFVEPADSGLSTDQIRLLVAKTEGALQCVAN